MKTNIVMIVDCDKSRKISREEVGCIVIKDEGKGSFGKHRKKSGEINLLLGAK